MSNRLLQNDLDDLLQSIPEMPSIHLENTRFTLQSDQANSTRAVRYCRTKLYPTSTVSETAAGGFDLLTGFYEVSLFLPSGAGVDEANYFADKILSTFKIGTIITNNLTIRVESHDRGVGQLFDNHYMLPVTVDYHCHIKRDQ